MPYRPLCVACKDLGWLRLMAPKWMTDPTMPVADHTKLYVPTDNVPHASIIY